MTMPLCRHDKSIMNTFRRSMSSSAEDGKWRRGCDVLQKTDVPDPNGGDWKSSVAVGWQSGTGNRPLMRVWDEAERRRFRNYDSAEWWSSSARYDGARPWTVKTFINKNGQLEFYPPIETVSQWSDHITPHLRQLSCRCGVIWSHFDDEKTYEPWGRVHWLQAPNKV